MRQGEIWEINLSPTVGAEIKKERPAVIINDDAIGILPLKVIVPITAWRDRFQGAIWMVRIEPDDENKLTKPSTVDTFQVRSVSQLRLVEKLGILPAEDLASIDQGLRLSLHLEG